MDAAAAKRRNWSVTSRFRCMFLVTLFLSTSFFLMLTSRSNHITFYRSMYSLYGSQLAANQPQNVAVKTEGCSMPALHPFDDSIIKFVEKPNVSQCLDANMMPLENNQTHIWIKNNFLDQYKSANNETFLCCYRPFSRPVAISDINKNVDNRVTYEECRNFSDVIHVNAHDEFVKVNCSIVNSTIEQMFLFGPEKEFMSHNNAEAIKEDDLAYNILILGIDGVSRLNLHRTMPKTIQYLKNKGAVEFLSYNKVGDNTFPNLIPMLLGISVEELNTTCLPYKTAKFDNCPFLWEWFKQAGYYTALAEDSSWLGTFNYLRAGFINTPTDYYLHTFIQEAEVYNKKNNHTDSKTLSYCLNDKYFYKILLDYVENLTISLKSKKLFGFFWEITMSHDYLNFPKVMDDDYVNFFMKLEKSSYLNNTILLLVSDHGIRWGSIRKTKQGRLEERLPFVFVLAPPSFRSKYSEAFKNLQYNSNRLSTPYDLHATLLDLIQLENINNSHILSRSKEPYGNKRGISFFIPIPTNRTCEMAGIDDHWCTCHKEQPVANDSPEAEEVAFNLVKHLNSLLKDHSKCATLEVAEIIETTEMVVGTSDMKESASWREFIITIRAYPGEGVFEATMRNSSTLRWSVSGTVSRLNLYGNQSACVEDNQLKLYCFCT